MVQAEISALPVESDATAGEYWSREEVNCGWRSQRKSVGKWYINKEAQFLQRAKMAEFWNMPSEVTTQTSFFADEWLQVPEQEKA